MDAPNSSSGGISPPLGSLPNANSSCQILPPASIGSGNYDRAWNDPPVFSLQVNAMGGGRPVPTKLTKRVAYPGEGISTPGIGPEPASRSHGPGLPRPPPMTYPPPTKVDFIPSFPSPGSTPEDETQPTTGSGSASSNTEVKLSVAAAQVEDDETRGETKEGPAVPVGSKCQLIKLLEESLNMEPYLEASVTAEIRKRMEILDSKWETLPTEVKLKLSDLSKCLEVKDYKGADTLQLNLSASFMSHCGPWIMALKQIIRKHLE